ncbi:MAG: HWE histidine kinase domain-containing protein [Pseudooceanicola atlanticus]
MTPPTPERAFDADQVDLSNCEREPIHILGTIQTYGYLLALSPDWIVAHASDNIADLLGQTAQEINGVPVADLLPEVSIRKMRAKMQGLLHEDATVRIIDFDLFGDGRRFDAAIHQSGRSFVLEVEQKADLSPDRDDLGAVQALVHRISTRGSMQEMLDQAAQGIRMISGFDRVMVYKFAADDSGEVVAEAKERSLESYRGLRFPASDIPKQARALYTRNLLRLIADVNAPVSAVTPAVNPEGEPLDLSLAATRAVSPIHLEYLRNMGVQASMSVSILRRGKLWGLLACHNRTPHYIDFEKRTAIELFGQLFAYELAQWESEAETVELQRAQGLHDRVISRMADGEGLLEFFSDFADDVSQSIAHDGIAIFSGGAYKAYGSAPTKEEFLGLARFLNTAPLSRVYSTNEISCVYPMGESFSDRACGMLALPISRTPRDYIVLFRKEVTQQVTWAGNPDKPVEAGGPNGQRLTPRKSFEAWQQTVTGCSAPWSDAEVRMADALRVTLLEVVLKITDKANADNKRAHDQQELLIAELNHRVRNILNLIRGLVSQSRVDDDSVETYIASLDGRIQSLARAHDQLTRQDWSAVSLRELVEVEIRAFLADNPDRVEISGTTPLLSPAAYSGMALVFHELVTNSVKYGALSTDSGRVSVQLMRANDGALRILWSERGGPPVRAPKRRGFGSAIIERTVPHELQGTARVDYNIAGLVAEFSIPERHVGGDAEGTSPLTEVDTAVALPDHPLEGHGLVVEDTMIIALDATDMMKELGCDDVSVAATNAEALSFLEDGTDVTVALVDVNLGQETSVVVADRLTALGIPYLLATGYGETGAMRQTFPDVKVVQKPYSTDSLRAAFAEVIASN